MQYRQIGPPWARMRLYVQDEELTPGVDSLFSAVEDRNTICEEHIRIDVFGDEMTEEIKGRIPEANRAGHTLIDDKYYAYETDWAGAYDLNSRTGSVAISKGDFTGLDSFLRQIAIHQSYVNGYLPLHSVAFEYRGKTYICPGESDSGKSTIAGLIMDEATVYSDELNVVGGEPARVWSLPFRGTSPNRISPGGGAVDAILIHRKATTTSVDSISEKDTLREVEKNVVIPLFGNNNIKNRAFDLLSGILGSVNAHIINFPKDSRAFLDALETIEGD